MALVGTLSGAEEIQGAPNIFHVRTSYPDEISQIVSQLGGMAISRIALFYANDAFGKSGRKAFENALAAQGHKSVAIASYDVAPDKVAASVEQAADSLAAAQPQAIVMVAVGEPVYAFIQRFRSKQASTRLVSMSVVNPDVVTQKTGLELARGMGFSQVFPYPHNDKVPLVRDYRRLLKKYAPEAKPSYFSLEGYVDGLVLINALKSAGPTPTRAKVLDALSKMPELDLGGFFIRFKPNTHNGSKFTELTVISSDGRLMQ